jgi:hypothetical protein
MKNNLTENQKQRIQNIDLIVGSVALLGAIGGVIYAKRTGGGFLRYVGYWIVGGLVAGIPSRLVATPFKNKILKDADEGVVKSGKNTNMATQDDALKITKILGEKDTPYTPQQVKSFTTLYSQNITKDEHNNIIDVVSKKESDWTEKDKLYFSTLLEKVIKQINK